MRLVLLVALSLAFTAIVAAPTASAVCSGDTWIEQDCRNAICTVKNVKGPWLMDCWGIVGPPP